jgi:aldose 1-epimerase
MNFREIVAITDGIAEAVIAPELGAGLASYDLIVGGAREPMFRACRDVSQAHPFDLALNLLAPWSNRISGGGFAFEGEFYRLAPNLPGEDCPIHGNAFSSAWMVTDVQSSMASLALTSDGPGPFRYDAGVSYELTDGALSIQLWARNAGDRTLPFGLGLHPWLPRTPATRLQASACRVVLEDSRHLPADEIDVDAREEWNFRTPRSLPDEWINNAFLGWDSRARVIWEDRGLTLEIAAEPALTTYVLYSPSSEADFFCFEPVTHPVDAHNLKGGAQANGLIALRPGEEIALSVRFTPRAFPGSRSEAPPHHADDAHGPLESRR